MNSRHSWPGIVAAFAVFAAIIGYFSESPKLQLRGADTALLKLSISQQGELRFECRERSSEELEQLPPNMRKPMDCPRERWPLHVTLRMDEQTLFDTDIPPTGLAKDGTSYAYRRLPIPAGEHTYTLTVLDSQEPGAEPDRQTRTLVLAPGQVLVMEYVDGNFRLTYPGKDRDDI